MTPEQAADLIGKLGFPTFIAVALGLGCWKLIDRFLKHLESSVEKQDAVNKEFTTTLTKISTTMETVADSQRQNMAEFRAVAPTICRNFEPRGKP